VQFFLSFDHFGTEHAFLVEASGAKETCAHVVADFDGRGPSFRELPACN
jgi:hypothetical protein